MLLSIYLLMKVQALSSLEALQNTTMLGGIKENFMINDIWVFVQMYAFIHQKATMYLSLHAFKNDALLTSWWH